MEQPTHNHSSDGVNVLPEVVRAYASESAARYSGFATDFAAYWADHLQRSRAFVLRGSELTSGRRSVVLLGAGACRDLPIETFLTQFEQVHLVDIDATSLNEGVRSLGPEGTTAHLHRHVWDASGGLVSRLVIDCETILNQAKDFSGTLTDASALFDAAAHEPVTPPEPLRQADYVVSSGLTSQLVTFLQRYLGEQCRTRFPNQQAAEAERTTFVSATNSLNERLFRRHAELLGSMLKDTDANDGVVCWLDTIAEAPFWGRIPTASLVAILQKIGAYLKESGFGILANAKARSDLAAAQTPNAFLTILAGLVRGGHLTVEETRMLIDFTRRTAIETSPEARAEVIAGGLAPWFDGVLAAIDPPSEWRWILKPTELASLEVEGHLLRKKNKEV